MDQVTIAVKTEEDADLIREAASGIPVDLEVIVDPDGKSSHHLPRQIVGESVEHFVAHGGRLRLVVQCTILDRQLQLQTRLG